MIELFVMMFYMSKYPELDSYIEKARKEGKTEIQLQQEMKSSGYDQKDIDSILKPKASKKSKRELIISLILAILIFGGGTLYAYVADIDVLGILNRELGLQKSSDQEVTQLGYLQLSILRNGKFQRGQQLLILDQMISIYI